jgi:hypothetical protein
LEACKAVADLVPGPLPLRNIEVPREVTAVTGCDCGGLEWHDVNCTAWELSLEQRTAAIAYAQDRLAVFTDGLNTRLRAAWPVA